MSGLKHLDAAKARLIQVAADQAWWVSVGIGLVGDRPGLILSVRKSGEAEASRCVEGLKLGAPVRVRVVDEIRPRGGLR